MNGEMEAMYARLQRVEHRLRVVSLGWLMSIVVFGVLAIGVQLAISQQPGTWQPVIPQDVVRARSIEVVDGAGSVRISLNVSPEGIAEIALTESMGKGRMWLTVRPDGISSMTLADSMGKGRIWMTAYSDRSSGLILSDPSGKGRIWLGASSDGSSNLLLLDSGGRVVFQAR
ncbi:MAG: hypothetical protein ACT4PY_01620 [Armatimonadota bacterium]